MGTSKIDKLIAQLSKVIFQEGNSAIAVGDTVSDLHIAGGMNAVAKAATEVGTPIQYLMERMHVAEFFYGTDKGNRKATFALNTLRMLSGRTCGQQVLDQLNAKYAGKSVTNAVAYKAVEEIEEEVSPIDTVASGLGRPPLKEYERLVRHAPQSPLTPAGRAIVKTALRHSAQKDVDVIDAAIARCKATIVDVRNQLAELKELRVLAVKNLR